jgi:hypothetical protein
MLHCSLPMWRRRRDHNAHRLQGGNELGHVDGWLSRDGFVSHGGVKNDASGWKEREMESKLPSIHIFESSETFKVAHTLVLVPSRFPSGILCARRERVL